MIVIGFSRSNDLKGKIIRAVTGGYWNHAWVGYSHPVWGGQWITHADSSTGQVISQRAELLKEEYEESCCFGVIGLNIELGMKRTRNYVNKKYDLASVMWNGIIMLIYRSTGIELFNPIIDHNRMSCSEFVTLILQRSGFEDVQFQDAELFPPDGLNGLYPIFKKSPNMYNVNFEHWVDGAL